MGLNQEQNEVEKEKKPEQFDGRKNPFRHPPRELFPVKGFSPYRCALRVPFPRECASLDWSTAREPNPSRRFEVKRGRFNHHHWYDERENAQVKHERPRHEVIKGHSSKTSEVGSDTCGETTSCEDHQKSPDYQDHRHTFYTESLGISRRASSTDLVSSAKS